MFDDRDLQQDLAQFEPDPDGDGERRADPPPAATGDDTAQWIAWPDESGPAAWAAEELRELTGHRR